MCLPYRLEGTRLPLVGGQELGAALLGGERALEQRLEMGLPGDLTVGDVRGARFQIPACAMDLA
jgi:hypothetical protein